MSEDNMSNIISSCASCGIAEVDEVKLKECTDCDIVRYCGIKCEQEDKLQHQRAYKKRATELRDKLLFKQPESSHRGDCPICCLPLPLDPKKSTMHNCCSKVICKGCSHANKIREIEGKLSFKCPFCRKPVPDTDKELSRNRMKRIEANDPVAMRREGFVQYEKGNYSSAVEYYTKATELGDVDAHFRLSILYHNGQGVEKDRGKDIYHLEEAAIGGHPNARYNLGVEENESGNIERAVKNFIIAATQGHDGSIKALMEKFKEGFVSKDDLAAALRAQQAAVDATKSPQREAADAYVRKMRSP